MNFDIDIGNVEQSAKRDGHGQAKILTNEELEQLFEHGLLRSRDRALFAICLFTGCRVSEACQLQASDISGGLVTFRKATTKGKGATRQVGISEGLAHFLEQYDGPGEGYLFPGRHGRSHITRAGAHKILNEACGCVGLEGVSTHSFRRTYITRLRDKGYSPAQIKRRTGHKRIASMLHYFDQV